MLSFSRRKTKPASSDSTKVSYDPDNPPLTEPDLRSMRPVSRVRRLRQRLTLSQASFADRFHLSLATVRDWEQGRTTPDRAASNFIALIEQEPDFVADVLSKAADRQTALLQEREGLRDEARHCTGEP